MWWRPYTYPLVAPVVPPRRRYRRYRRSYAAFRPIRLIDNYDDKAPGITRGQMNSTFEQLAPFVIGSG